jgi:ribonuclease Z
MKLKSIILLVLITMNLYAQRDFSNSEITKVVLLGTGTPIPDPDRSGCSVAIIVNSMPYIIDFGSGLIRRLAARTDR